MSKKREKASCVICGRDFGKLTLRGKDYYCPDHLRTPRFRDGTHKNWPLITSNLADPNETGGKPLVIENLRQLRRLENRYGAQSHVYNMDQSNIVEHNRK